jgi:hypothetical protein
MLALLTTSCESPVTVTDQTLIRFSEIDALQQSILPFQDRSRLHCGMRLSLRKSSHSSAKCVVCNKSSPETSCGSFQTIRRDRNSRTTDRERNNRPELLLASRVPECDSNNCPANQDFFEGARRTDCGGRPGAGGRLANIGFHFCGITLNGRIVINPLNTEQLLIETNKVMNC